MTAFPVHVLVTGTSTGVGKTIATAGYAAALASAGWRVVVVKPVQTGADGSEPSDAETIRRLTGLPGVGHTCQMEAPDEFVTVVAPFLDETARVG